MVIFLNQIFSVQQNFFNIPNPLKCNSFEDCVGLIAEFIYKIAIPIAVIMILYAGLLFMISGGNEGRVRKAKNALTWALIGIAILVVGGGFVYLIKDIMGVT